MRKKVALIHHNILSHRGGGDLVCAWVLEALTENFDTTFVTWGKKIDWDEVDRFYGTSIHTRPIKTLYHPILTAFNLENRPYRLIIALLERYVKQLNNDFDLLFSTYNELDLGKPGMQYIHGPSRSDEGAKLYLLEFKKSFLRKAYHDFCDWFSGYDPGNISKNYTLVNSNWTSTVVRQTFGNEMPIETVYPPVLLLSQPQPWEKRKNEFLIVGDILPEKKTHLAVDVIKALRDRGHDVTLKIVGDSQNEFADFVKSYAKKFPFVTHAGRLNREKVSQLISETKYGIHMRDYEGFGIAIAEMVRGGAIPFAPNHGGQMEVLGNNPALLFDNVDEAVEKIDRVLKQSDLQRSILEQLSRTGANFSVERFKSQICSIVEKRLQA